MEVVKSVCFPDQPESKERPRYLATAGSPGARKTTILERFLHSHPEYSDCIYLDPDPRTLKYMVHTYISQSLSPFVSGQTLDYGMVIQEAYQKWRAASNYICTTLLDKALLNRYDLAHGTTLTGEVVPSLLKAIHDAGYEITLLLCSAEDDFRFQSIQYRNEVQRFYQSSPEDAVKKGKAFPQRMEIYFAYADRLHFFWSDALAAPEKHAATIEHGILTIFDLEAWQKFICKYEEDRAAILLEGKTIPSWEELMAKYTER